MNRAAAAVAAALAEAGYPTARVQSLPGGGAMVRCSLEEPDTIVPHAVIMRAFEVCRPAFPPGGER